MEEKHIKAIAEILGEKDKQIKELADRLDELEEKQKAPVHAEKDAFMDAWNKY